MEENLASDLAQLYEEDLRSFIDNLKEFPETKLWEVPANIPNSAGILAQHLAGNLNYYIGTVLGKTGYERDRDAEFTISYRSRDELVLDLEEIIDIIKKVMPDLTSQQMEAPFPNPKQKSKTTRKALLQFYRHLNYHLGQLNYLKRILS